MVAASVDTNTWCFLVLWWHFDTKKWCAVIDLWLIDLVAISADKKCGMLCFYLDTLTPKSSVLRLLINWWTGNYWLIALFLHLLTPKFGVLSFYVDILTPKKCDWLIDIVATSADKMWCFLFLCGYFNSKKRHVVIDLLMIDIVAAPVDKKCCFVFLFQHQKVVWLMID